MTMPRLVVFDLDGTLVDSQADLATAANRLLASYGFEPLGVAEVAGMVGEGARRLVERVLAARGVEPDHVPADALPRYLAHYEACLLDETRLYDGVDRLVSTLATRAVLAVITNKPTRPAMRLLEHFGLAEAFAAVVGGDDRFPRKPDPTSLVELAARVGARRDECLMVGDSWIDLETARRAGVPAACARYGFGFDAIPPASLAGVTIVDRPLALLERLGLA